MDCRSVYCYTKMIERYTLKQVFKKSAGKVLLRCNHRAISVSEASALKRLGKLEYRVAEFLPQYSLPMTAHLRRTLRPKTASLRVSRCETFCAHPAVEVTSVHLQGAETQCWGLCGQVWRGAVLPMNYQEKCRQNHREAGPTTQPPWCAFWPWQQPFSGPIGLRQK